MFKGILYTLKSAIKKPFKVGIITYRYPGEKPVNGGVGIYAHYLSRELTRLGCEVHVFCYGEKKSIKTEYIENGKLVIHRIETKLPSFRANEFLAKYISSFIFDNKIIEELAKENSQEKFDIINSNGRLLGGIFISKYLTDIKWINTIHSLEKNRLKLMPKEEKKYANIFKWMESTIRHADAIITVSQKLKIEVLQGYPVDEKKVYYIPNGVDTEIFKPENTPNLDKKVLYVGRFSLEKGIDLLPNIIRKIFEKNNEIKFEIVASTDKIPASLEKTKQQFEELEKQYPERIIWHKEILTKEELIKLYNQALMIIQPSRYDSFPTTILESMACGKAVIVSNRGGMPEMVENAGIIIPLNTNTFAREILKLAKDYKLRERYGRRGLEKVKQFQWKDIAKKSLELYKKITGTLKKGESREEF